MHISFHQVGNDVDIFVSSRSGRFLNINHRDHVFMVEELQKLDLSYDSFCIDEILESLRDLLDGDFVLRLVIVGRAHDTVGTMSYLLYVLVLVIDYEGSTRADEGGLALDLLCLNRTLYLIGAWFLLGCSSLLLLLLSLLRILHHLSGGGRWLLRLARLLYLLLHQLLTALHHL